MSGFAARRRLAWLGIAAILFQAVLFGWHHHDFDLPARGAPLVATANGGAPLTPATDEDGCEVCIALHHLSAAPGTLIAIAPPAIAALALVLANLALPRRTGARGFDARAPPRS